MIDLNKGYIEFTGVEDLANPIWSSSLIEDKINCYEELMAKALIMRANKKDPAITTENQGKIFPYIKHILEWLRSGDFYTSPASIKYHENFYGGLLIHTLEVYVQLVSLRSVKKFATVVEDQWWSAVFVTLVHDWCKIGRYESYYKNVKNDKTSIWEQVPAYRYKEDSVGRLGHGTQSLIMAMQLCSNKLTSLSFEEMTAIRWHMDNWDMSNYDMNDLSRCNESIPMVRMIQFADQLAITCY